MLFISLIREATSGENKVFITKWMAQQGTIWWIEHFILPHGLFQLQPKSLSSNLMNYDVWTDASLNTQHFNHTAKQVLIEQHLSITWTGKELWRAMVSSLIELDKSAVISALFTGDTIIT